MKPSTCKRPAGFVVIGIFFFFAATMACYAGFTLLFPGTPLDRAWALNEKGHARLAPLGRIMALPFAVLAAVALFTAIEWFKRRRWAWVLGVSMIVFNLAADIINMALGEFWKGAAGVLLAGVLVIYMTRRGVRDYLRGRG